MAWSNRNGRRVSVLVLMAFVSCVLGAGRISSTSWRHLLSGSTRLVVHGSGHIEEYDGFGNNGVVGGNFGSRDALAAPSLYWTIQDETLVICDDRGREDAFRILLRYGPLLITRRTPGYLSVLTMENPGP